jgi:hypothetical protein
MDSDDFSVSASSKMELVLSYNFQMRKQGGKSFFRHTKTYFFRKRSLRKGRPFVHREKGATDCCVWKKYPEKNLWQKEDATFRSVEATKKRPG